MAFVKCDDTYDTAVEHARTLFPSLASIPKSRIAFSLYRDDPAGATRVSPRAWSNAVMTLPNYNVVDVHVFPEGRSVYDGKEIRPDPVYGSEKVNPFPLFAPPKVERTIAVNHGDESVIVVLSDDYEEALDMMMNLFPDLPSGPTARARIALSYDILHLGEVCNARIAAGDWPLTFSTLGNFDNMHVEALAEDMVPASVKAKEAEALAANEMPPPYKRKGGFFSSLLKIFLCRK